MFVVRCPECRHIMRYQPVKAGAVTEKQKRCVYCGRSFKVHPSLVESRIVREESKNTSTALLHTPAQAKEFSEKASRK